jgi:hypothetical protein
LESLQTASFNTGDYIVRQGELGDTFHIIQTGEVKVVEEFPALGSAKARGQLCMLYEGHHFGEYR